MAKRGFNRWRLEEWGDPCSPAQSIVRATVGPSECKTWVNDRMVEAVDALGAVFAMGGYQVRSCGAYNCRRITNGSVWSAHAWGIAIDINPGDNPFTDRGLVTDIPLAIIEHVYRIRTAVSGQRVWKWGGDWDGDWDFDDHTVWDAMHFESIVTPAELAEGIEYDGATTPEVSPTMFVSHGARSTTVEYWQRKLKRLGHDLGDGGPDGDGVDGIYGELTDAAVRAAVPGSDGARIGPREAEQIEWEVASLVH